MWQNQESGIVKKPKLFIAQKIDKTKGVSKVTYVEYFQNDISLIHTASAYFIDEEMHLYPMISDNKPPHIEPYLRALLMLSCCFSTKQTSMFAWWHIW